MRAHRALAYVLFLAVAQILPAQKPEPPLQKPGADQAIPAVTSQAPPPPMAEQIRKTVAFIGVNFQNGTFQGVAIGTCFFVSFPDERVGKNGHFIYLVTNRHVAQPGIDLGTPYQTRGASMRMNLANSQGDVQSIVGEIPLGPDLHWYFPADDAVDLAVLPIAPDHNTFDYLVIPFGQILNGAQLKSNNFGIGDAVTFAGYFSSFPGHLRMEPILRQGIIAMLPAEKFETTLHKPGQLYLADLHAFHGNSGSPVFVNQGGFHHGSITSADHYLLVGVISGYYPESTGFSVPAASVLTGEVKDNSGIAVIVPADELVKLLTSVDLQAQREKVLERLKKKP